MGKQAQKQTKLCLVCCMRKAQASDVNVCVCATGYMSELPCIGTQTLENKSVSLLCMSRRLQLLSVFKPYAGACVCGAVVVCLLHINQV